MKNSNIILIGMPGAGKSTLGVLLAKELAREFVDTDLLIQNHAGKTLQDIIYENGYVHLRELEEATVLTLALDNQVVATGGSVVYGAGAMQHLSKLGQIIYLELPLEDLAGRIHNMDSRGIARPEGQSFEDVYKERAPLYRHYADITINCRGKSPAEVVQEIIYAEAETFAGEDA